MDDLQEEADRLFNDIWRGDSSALERYQACDALGCKRFLDLMEKRQNDGSNMLIFAIVNRKYKCAESILEILKFDVGEYGSSKILLARDDQGNDCLRSLMLNSISPVRPTVRLSSRQLTFEETKHEKKDIDAVLSMLLEFTNVIQQLAIGEKQPTGEKETVVESDTFKEENAVQGATVEKEATHEKEGATCEREVAASEKEATEDGPTGEDEGRNGAIFWAIENRLEYYAEKVFHVLPVHVQLKLIKQTVECKGIGHRYKNDLYNLLMLSLRVPVHEPLVDTVLDIICSNGDQTYKAEVVMGKDKPEVFSQSENSLRLAARTRNQKHLLRLWRECVPEDLQFKALLEVGPCGSSTMSLLLAANDIKTVAKLSQFLVKGQSLRKTLYDPATRSNFIQLEMAPIAIELFLAMKLLHYSFLIPKPSKSRRLSQPLAWIFSHEFGDAESEPSENAKGLSGVLQGLGWHENRVNMAPAKKMEEIVGIPKNCSFLLLCFTGHRPLHFDKSLLKNTIRIISESSLSKFVPKAVIFDGFGGDDDILLEHLEKLREHNILWLSIASSGKFLPELTFLPELVKQIEAADGKTSLQEMFTAAVEKVNSRYREVNNKTEQPESERESISPFTPLIEPLCKRIVLRRYDGKENTCRICDADIRSCSQQCMICSTCLKWYHLSCLNIDEGHLELSRTPGFKWLCETCHDRVVIVGV